MNSKVLLSVLAGVAAGAFIGILFAPDKGSVTRRKVSRKSREYTDDLKDKFNEFIDSVSEKFERVEEESEEIAGKGKAKFHEIKKEVRNGMNGKFSPPQY
jgi:gas vesicle protein